METQNDPVEDGTQTLDDTLWDVLIVGGSVAGLSAALVLGRSRRRVLVVDSGEPCNRFSAASHGFFTRDGMAPGELLEIGRAQLANYPNVTVQHGRVVILRPSEYGYVAALADERVCLVRKVLLATGVRDQLPPLSGIEQFWGRSVVHCPYCDGWEIRDKPVAIYAQGEHALHLTKMVRNLTADVVLCTGGQHKLREQDEQLLNKHGVQVIDVPIQRLHGEGDQLTRLEFVNGSTLEREALFVQPTRTQPSDLLRQVGCTLDANGILQVDALGRTAVEHVYAAGDLVNHARQVALSASSGAMTGAGINRDLVEEAFQ